MVLSTSGKKRFKVKRVEPCRCEAYPFPHRARGGACSGYPLCAHGYPIEGHPDFSEDYQCRSCRDEDAADRLYDEFRDRQMDKVLGQSN